MLLITHFLPNVANVGFMVCRAGDICGNAMDVTDYVLYITSSKICYIVVCRGRDKCQASLDFVFRS